MAVGIVRQQSRSLPGVWRYVLGGVIVAAGVVGFVVFLVTRISGFSQGLVRVVVPGTQEISLEAGSYTIYWESSGFGGWPGVGVTITSKSTATPVGLSRTWVNSNYSIGGKRGVSMYSAEIPATGTYVVDGAYPPGKSGGDVTLAMGRSSILGIVLTVFGCIAILGGSIAIGVGLIVTTAIRRKRGLP
jgi:hypothetical protein